MSIDSEGSGRVSADVLVAEIGSTTTVVTAYDGIIRPAGSGPRLLGQGMALTTVRQGDVTKGLGCALADLAGKLGLRQVDGLGWQRMLASSSAAGGLRMSVHGLVYDMTVRAAREAALGAGAVVRMVTAGVLTGDDLRHLAELKPNIILLAGGVDYGERETVLANAALIAGAVQPGTPVVYAGNSTAAGEAARLLGEGGMRVRVVENVYPRIDDLNVEPARRAIQEVFEEHIVHAPGMERIRELVDGRIIPTPGAVMNAAQLLYSATGDLMAVDVGGATTDVHSVTTGSEEIARLAVSPEPLAKRTVEGDLGVFLNAGHSRSLFRQGELEAALGASEGQLADLVRGLGPLPREGMESELVRLLAEKVTKVAALRHAGRIRHLYGPGGRTTVAEGKDLTRVGWIIGTGGPLTRLPGGEETLGQLRTAQRGAELLPGPEARLAIDHHYIMAPCGVMAGDYPEAALTLLLRSLGFRGEGANR